MTLGKVAHGELEIAYETLGGPTGEPLLLIMGTGGQMLSWPDGFCDTLTDWGFCVARFDNRDAGLSTHLSGHGKPNQLGMLLRPASAAVYRLEDMAGDAVAVLDALGWPAAHVVGISQGGMIAQTLAVHHPDRVLTLTSISSAPAPRLGQPKPGTLLKMVRIVNPKRVKSAEDFGQYLVDLQQIVGSPAYPVDEAELRERGRRGYERGGVDIAAVQRQTAAIAASGDRRADLAGVRMPTLVLHGQDDRLIRPPAGLATAEAIPGARLVTYPGMGHELPRPLWDDIANEIARLARDRRDNQGEQSLPGGAG